jgi:DNA-binding NarL/FixJ family response regulator
VPIRILIADRYPYFRLGLKLLLERAGHSVVAEASTAAAAVELASQVRPDVAILALQQPMKDSVCAAKELHSQSPKTRNILLARKASELDALPPIPIDHVAGLVLKSEPFAKLAETINDVASGALCISAGSSKSRKPLTAREIDVLTLIGRGRRLPEIASCLALSTKTVEMHRSAVMQKLNIRETAGLVRYAIREGLVQVRAGDVISDNVR